MFWKKKTKTEEPSKPKIEKLHGPSSIEAILATKLIVDLKQHPDLIWNLHSVVRQRSGDGQRFDFRIFDAARVAATRVEVKDYTSFDDYPELIVFQGWFDKESGEVHFEEKKPV
ncbi:hypothetical protein ACFLU4_09100 [Chloroflexota bacterium]